MKEDFDVAFTLLWGNTREWVDEDVRAQVCATTITSFRFLLPEFEPDDDWPEVQEALEILKGS